MDKKKNKLQIRNSTAEFLVFTNQDGKNSIEVRVEDETVWLTQKLRATLFDGWYMKSKRFRSTNLYA